MAGVVGNVLVSREEDHILHFTFVLQIQKRVLDLLRSWVSYRVSREWCEDGALFPLSLR